MPMLCLYIHCLSCLLSDNDNKLLNVLCMYVHLYSPYVKCELFFRSIYHQTLLGTAVAQWLRYCTTDQKVAGSIAAGVIGIFH